GPERREVQRNVVAVLPHEVLALLQRAVVEAQEDVEHELRELAAAILGGAALAVHRAYEPRRGGGRDELRLDEARGEALELEGQRLALFGARQRAIGDRVIGDRLVGAHARGKR